MTLHFQALAFKNEDKKSFGNERRKKSFSRRQRK